jgi:hypothetical protein
MFNPLVPDHDAAVGIYAYGVFVLEVKEATHNCAAYLILKIIEVMASLPWATMAKACRRTYKRTEGMVKDGGILMKKNTYPNGHFQKGLLKYCKKITVLLHSLSKLCQCGRFIMRTLSTILYYPYTLKKG